MLDGDSVSLKEAEDVLALHYTGQWQAEHSGWSVQRCSTESGHSFIQWLRLRDIEKRLKYHSEIYVPKCWYIIAEAWSGSKPLAVYQMKQEDFLSMTALEIAIVNWKTTVDGRKSSGLRCDRLKCGVQIRCLYTTKRLTSLMNHGNKLISQDVAIAQCCQESHRRDCMKDLVSSIPQLAFVCATSKQHISTRC